MLKFPSPHFYALCQAGAEKHLKDELQREWPVYRFGYSRPGFVTFKHSDGKDLAPSFPLGSIFARDFAVSIGKLKDPTPNTIREAAQECEAIAHAAGKKFLFQLCEREQHAPDEEPLSYRRGAWTSQFAPQLSEAAPHFSLSRSSERAETGTWVFEWVCVEENEIWIGVREQNTEHSGRAGGALTQAIPPDCPSRAYLKVTQAIELWNIPLTAGQRVLELGCAPGGMSMALLERGLEVWGVDPGEVSPVVRRWPNGKFRHIQKTAHDLIPGELPGTFDWFVVDMHLRPDQTVKVTEPLWQALGRNAVGALVVLKLNDDRVAHDLHEILNWLKSWGFSRMRVRQLPANKREVTVFAQTPKGSLSRARGVR